MYNMHRDREFPMKTNNLAAFFLGLFESLSYIGWLEAQKHNRHIRWGGDKPHLDISKDVSMKQKEHDQEIFPEGGI